MESTPSPRDRLPGQAPLIRQGSSLDSTRHTAWRAHRQEPFIIGVAGGTASGKSTVCDLIVQRLQDQSVALLSQDSFYRSLTSEERASVDDHNFDAPGAFDQRAIVDCLQSLRHDTPYEVPVYDFSTHSRSGETRRALPADVIIIEGILVLHMPEVRELLNMKIFVDTDDDVRLARRIQRDIAVRGRDVAGVITQYTRFVKPSFDNFVAPSRRHADVIIPWHTAEPNAVAIDLIAQHIRSKLQQHDLRRIYPNLELVPSNFQIRGMHTIIRNRETSKADFVFYADRLLRLVVEAGLGHLPFSERTVVTPTGHSYVGVDFAKKLCGVSIIRSGESMENALRACCEGIKIGKILVHRERALADRGRRACGGPTSGGCGDPGAAGVTPPEMAAVAVAVSQSPAASPATTPRRGSSASETTVPARGFGSALSLSSVGARAEAASRHVGGAARDGPSCASSQEGSPVSKALGGGDAGRDLASRRVPSDEATLPDLTPLELAGRSSPGAGLPAAREGSIPQTPSSREDSTGAAASGLGAIAASGPSLIVRPAPAPETGAPARARSGEGGDEREIIYQKLPRDIASRYVLLLDPILATGNSAVRAIEVLLARGVKQDRILFLTLIAAPAGVRSICRRFPQLKLIASEIDESVQDGLVIPGVGEFGNRYFCD